MAEGQENATANPHVAKNRFGASDFLLFVVVLRAVGWTNRRERIAEA
jgi:hypothetical protein